MMSQVGRISVMRARKAIRLVRWIYSQPERAPSGGPTMTRKELIAYAHEFQELEENRANRRFWDRLSEAAGEETPSQSCIEIVIDILDLIAEVK